MNTEKLKAILDKKGYSYETTPSGIVVDHKGHVDLRSLTSLPENIKFENQGAGVLK